MLTCAVRADYDCLCSYNVETSVYAQATQNSDVLAYLYEFDCKPTVTVGNTDPQYITIAFDHMVGYVPTAAGLKKQTCQGNPPTDDILTTSLPNTEMTSQTTTTTAAQTVAPTTSAPSTAMPTAATTMKPTTMQPTTFAPTTVMTAHNLTTAPSSSTQQPTTVTKATTLPTTVITAQPIETRAPRSTATAPATSTAQPATGSSTSPAIVSGHTNLCPVSMRVDAMRTGGIVTQYGSSCYELVPSKHHWSNAEAYCQKNGGHLFHISSDSEEQFILGFLRSHNFSHGVWMGLHDRKNEEHFEWTSGVPVTFTNWTPNRKSNFYSHEYEDCVVFVPYLHNGEWDDIPCGQTVGHTGIFGPSTESQAHSFICQIGGINTNPTLPPSGSAIGDIHRCPSYIQSHAAKGHYQLAQYGSSCYELVARKATWSHAEQYCEQGGGNLFHVSSAAEQTFMEDFLNNHGFSHHAVWMGLHDRKNEEHFEWTSGDPVTYTNWTPNRKYNGVDHNNEDCALFVPYLNQGQWDDVHCGYSSVLGDLGNVYPWVCQFGLTAHIPNQGGLVG